MHRSLVLALLVACGGTPHSGRIPADPLPTAAPAAMPAALPVAPVGSPTLDEAAVKDKSHALFDAFDRADVAAFNDAIGPTFILFVVGRFYDRAFLEKQLQARTDRHAPIHSRTWRSERVLSGPGVAVFIGEAIETVPAEETHPTATQDRWSTLVWTYDGTRWTAAHWQTRSGGGDAERDAWNETLSAGVNFNHKPNQLLVDTVKGRKPGTALDIAMGQGRNAVFLASQGWKVTGVDISDEGIRLAKEAAASGKLKLDAVQADINTWNLGTAKWDLVTLIYAGTQANNIAKIKGSVKKGGLVVVEFFQKEATQGTGIGGFGPGELAGEFKDGWKILRDDAVEDTADWGLQKTKLVRFVAEKL